MGKLVVLKVGQGNFDQGFPVRLQIAEDGQPPEQQIDGRLPAAKDIPHLYSQWQALYYDVGAKYWEMRIDTPPSVTNTANLDLCQQAAQNLEASLRCWLRLPSMESLQNFILDHVRHTQPTRLILQTNDLLLRKLPWHLWELFESLPSAEFALHSQSAPTVEPLSSPVQILAVLGNNTGINTDSDWRLLQQLPGANITLLQQPHSEQLQEYLWRQSGEILFFAGHSFTQKGDQQGHVLINAEESLPLEQLRYALRAAVNNGLKLAIFNSCDGLGLIPALADAGVAHAIVMREPVPDKVAHTFLRYFLEAFAKGESLYVSVRRARERLQWMETEYPCAGWLPVICQNPMATALVFPQSEAVTQTIAIPPSRELQSPPPPGVQKICCVNPHCPRPQPQRWGDKHCSRCGSSLQLNERYIPLKCLSIDRYTASYTVYDASTQTEKVLKMMLSTKPGAKERFRHEAIALASINHSGLPKTTAHDFFDVTVNHPLRLTLPCLVMEKIPGKSLQQILDENPQGCSPAAVLDWLKQTVNIIRLLHSHQVVHRNIKPANLIIRQTTQKLVLVGLGGGDATLTGNATLPASYKPPEQRSRGEVNASTDFYALGLICIHLLTGQHPATLRDEMTGAIYWRRLVRVDAALADLLDEMVQIEVPKRLRNATVINTRLAQMGAKPQHNSPRQKPPRAANVSRSKNTSSFWFGLLRLPSTLSHSSDWGVQAAKSILQATLIAGLSGVVGAGLGYWLVYGSPLRGLFEDIFTKHLMHLLPVASVILSPAILVFACAGWGTAWGLDVVANAGSSSRLGTVRWMGFLGYAAGWIGWQTVAATSLVDAFGRLSGIAAVAVVLGIGLRSHQLLHVVMTAFGTTSTFGYLVRSQIIKPENLLILYPSIPSLHLIGSSEFWSTLLLLGYLGGAIGFWLAVSNICALPCLHFLSSTVQSFRDR